ncbi:MAG: hypothetical protein M3Z36_11970 [Acidobacteriota bacterium]|nr:hypothetical protein [Acidobacteriota bacterium]
MSRVAIFISLLFIAGCTNTGANLPPLPDTVAGGWHRAALQEAPLDAAPDLVRRTGLRKWWKAEYDGPGTVHVEIYALNSGGAGLDLVQKWRPSANTVTFYTDRYFIVVDWDGADRVALRSLVTALQKALAQPR